MSEVREGDIFEATTGSGRQWLVRRRARNGLWVLAPLGDDVAPAKDGSRLSGGVRTIRRGDEILLDEKRWRRVA